MKKLLRFFLPAGQKIPKSLLIVLGTGILCWIGVNLPFFENTFHRRMFAFNGTYWKDCFLSNSDPLSKLLSEFCSLGYASTAGIFLTVACLTALFLFSSRRAGGRYFLFLLPLWLILWPSADNARQEFAMGLLVNMACLSAFFSWIAYREIHRPDTDFYHEAFHLPFWIFYTIVTLACLRLTGISALLFTGTIVIYRFCLLFSCATKHNPSMESAAIGFTVYFITGACICLVYPKIWNLPDFFSEWSFWEWAALAIFCTAVVLGLPHRAFSEKEELPGKKPASSKPAWPWMAAGIAWCLLTASFTRSSLENKLVRVENDCRAGRYADMRKTCTDYFAKHPAPQKPSSAKEARMRTSLAAYARLSMIMSGSLASEFLHFQHIKEMQGMYPDLPRDLPTSNFALAKLYYETELYGSALNVLTHTCEQVSPQRRVFRLLLPIEAATYQKKLLDKHLPWVKQAPYMRNFAKKWQEIADESWAMGIQPQKPPLGMGLSVNAAQRHIDRLIAEKGDWAVFGGKNLSNWGYNNRYANIARDINLQRPFSQPCLEYYTLLCLMEGNIEAAPELARAYRRFEARQLPLYLQEAILLQSEAGLHPERLQDFKQNGFMGFAFKAGLIDRFAKAEQAIFSGIPLAQLEEPYGDTYWFYYRKNVESPLQEDRIADLKGYCPEPGLAESF